jgi:hypothetical protein
MRLLNTGSLKLKDFPPSQIPPYVILSHTWGEEEVLFEDIQRGTAKSKKGFTKVKGCCKKAKEEGFDWVCVNKANFTELSQAINSIFRWYRKAAKWQMLRLSLGRFDHQA